MRLLRYVILVTLALTASAKLFAMPVTSEGWNGGGSGPPWYPTLLDGANALCEAGGATLNKILAFDYTVGDAHGWVECLYPNGTTNQGEMYYGYSCAPGTHIVLPADPAGGNSCSCYNYELGGVCIAAPPSGGTCDANNRCTCDSTPTQLFANGGTCSTQQPKKFPPPCHARVGEPCDPATATEIHRETDYAEAGPWPIRITRTYTHLPLALQYSGQPADRGSGFGPDWASTFQQRLVVRFDYSPIVVAARRPDGRTLDFTQNGSEFNSDGDVKDRLEALYDSTGAITGWRYTVSNNDSIETYSKTGQLLSVQNRAGLVITATYTDGIGGPNGAGVVEGASTRLPGGLLLQLEDPFGRTVSFGYDASDRIVRMTDASGANYAYAYDANGNLASVTYPDGKIRSYQYNEPAYTSGANLPYALTGITDENGARFTTITYDASGKPISTQHAGGVELYSLTYNADGSADVASPLSATRTYLSGVYQAVPRTTGVTGPACPACGPASETFDANANVASSTDWDGHRTNYTYDLTRNLETQRVEGLAADGSATAQTRTISTQWDANFRLPTRIAEALRVTTNVYDPDGTVCGARGALCSKTIQATTDANGSQGFSATATGTPRVWTYAYNQNGSVLTVDGPRTDVADTTTYTYYANDDPDLGKRGNIATVTNALGQTTQITAYNANGQPLTVVDPNGLTTTLVYDARMRLTSRDVGGETTTYVYDGVGQLTKVTLPDSSYLSYSYDAAHRLTGIQDNLGNHIAYTLDAMGNRTQEEAFDPANNLAQTRSRVYSNLNRLYQEIGAAGQTTTYTYDNQGNVTGVTDPLNHTTADAYDALNRLIKVTDPNQGVTQYAYNGESALTSVTDPRNLVTGYTVDGLGNLTQQASPDTGTTTNAYDSAGNLLTQTDAKGQTTSYAYDALNRVTSTTFQDGSKQAYAYDQGANGLGRLTGITETDPSSQVTDQIAYAYDSHGRVTTETRTINGVVYVTGYSYDGFGRLSGMTYPSGRTVAYTFDALGRVSEIDTSKDGQTRVVVQNVQYQPFGGVKGYTLGNGQVYSRTIDQDGRIASYTLGASTYDISFDGASRITGIAEAGNPANVDTYGYDPLDRLTSAVLPSTSYGYSYDAVGNRLTKTVGASTDTYAYSPTSNQIASITPATGPVRDFAFDANGSTTNDGVNQYAYDSRGRMVQAITAQGTTTYQVNALGQRFRKTNSGDDRVFVYDTRGHLIEEADPGGAVKRELLYLGDIPVGVVQ